jgi:hypothetical protein
MRRSWLLFLAIFLASLTTSLFHFSPQKVSASFNANNLVSDTAFNFSNSMNALQIDNWLDTLPGSCISRSRGFTAADPTGYSPGGGYTYGNPVTAGQVISDAAQAYGINPQVLLTTLQKEQSLVSGGGCSILGYTGAMGYGCPDSGTTHSYPAEGALPTPLYYINGVPVSSVSGTCVNSASKVGFSEQIIHAAWLLKFGQQRSEGNTAWNVQSTNFPVAGDRWDNSDDPPTCYGGPMTQGTFKRCSMDSAAVAYDGWITIDGLATHMDTGPTAALYWYTPHFHGNQNFVSIFEGWFGSTQTPSTCTGTESQGSTVMRLYNPRTFEHFYTAYTCDINFLQRIGYQFEGSVFNTTDCNLSFAQPIYRYYNPYTGQHTWEATNIPQTQLDADKTGYRVEAGKVFCVLQAGVPNSHEIVRFYNPKTYLHIWTPVPNLSDYNLLVGQAGYSRPEYPPASFYTQ